MWQYNSTFAFILTTMGFYLYDNEGKLTVETSYGELEGLSSISRNGKQFYEFLGIPYAQPPIGNLRFASPVLPIPWNKTRDATYMGSGCLQINIATRMKQGNEDCLYLNVFTHQIQNYKKDVPLIDLHPVIFFIHGGGFMFGEAKLYQPKYFMDEDVVLVTINYRLASFGFLNIGHKDASGNMGLKDQVMALKWVQENIHYFGGDPNRVTIMGESAGAASVHFHMLSNMSKGLFHRAISQSGTALATWALIQKPLTQAQDFATKLNCQKKSPEEIIACLRELDADVIVNAHVDSLNFLRNSHSFFGPTIETLKASDTFINDYPINIMKSHDVVTKVPWIMGVNSEEGLLFAAPMIINETVRNELNTNWTYWAPKLLGYENEPKIRKNELSRRIWNYYFGYTTKGISMDTLSNVTNMLSDRLFFTNLHCVANLNQNNSLIDPPLYLYYYSYRSKFSLGKLLFGMSGKSPTIFDAALSISVNWLSTNIFNRPDKSYGTCHADEILLMFNIPYLTEHTKGTQDYTMSKTLIKLWSSFARDGEPTHVQNYNWPPVMEKHEDCINDETLSGRSIQYMNLNDVAELINEPFNDRIKFWNSLHFTTY